MKLAVVPLVALLALGCMEMEEEYTLNPDGSGKVKVSWVYAPMDFMNRGGNDPDELLKKSIRSHLSQAQGIDCWKDITFSLRDDGKIAFKGTAYFKKLDEVNLFGREMGPRNPLAQTFALEKNDKGNLVLTLKDPPAAAAAAGKPPAEEDVKKGMKKLRFRYQQIRPVLRAYLTDYRTKRTLVLPAGVEDARGFAKGDGGVRLDVDGEKLFKICDDHYLVDDQLKKAVEAGEDLEIQAEPGIPDSILSAYYGSTEFRATTKGEGKPAFEYDREVTEEVRAAYKKLLDSLPKDARFGMGAPAAAAEEDETPGRNAEEVLKEALVFDLGAEATLACRKSSEDLSSSLNSADSNDHNFTYEIRGPRFGRSHGSGGDRHLSLKLGDNDAVERFEYRSGPETLAVRQAAGGFLRITFENESNGMNGILARNSAGVQYVMMRGYGETVTRKWATLEEAVKSNPAEIGELLSRLKSAPIRMSPCAADPAVMSMALGWSDRLDEANRKKIDELRKGLMDDSLVERNKATEALKKEVGSDLLKLRHLADSMDAVKDEADARARMQAILDAHPEVAGSVKLVREKELHRDLTYLGALLADSARSAAAKARLKALTGRDFATRAEFDTWHAANKDKVKWDEKTGTYKGGP